MFVNNMFRCNTQKGRLMHVYIHLRASVVLLLEERNKKIGKAYHGIIADTDPFALAYQKHFFKRMHFIQQYLMGDQTSKWRKD